MMKNLFLRTLAAIALMAATLAHAQLRVEISGVGANQIPIAIAGFADESLSPQRISAIIKADLSRSGYFKIIDTDKVMSETTAVNFSEWKSRGVDALVVGSVQRLVDGRFDVRYKLLDTIKSSQLSALALAAQPQFTRVSGHKIADDIYEKLLGARGAFAPASPMSPKRDASIALKSPIRTARALRSHYARMNRSSPRHGRRMAQKWHTCRLKTRNRWCMYRI